MKSWPVATAKDALTREKSPAALGLKGKRARLLPKSLFVTMK